MPKTLTSHDDIRQWTSARGGNPMLMEVPDGSDTRTILQLTFGQEALNSDNNQGPDRIGGFQLVSLGRLVRGARRQQTMAARVRRSIGRQ
ncbi:hypothetical protein PSQ19_13135 [Devosia algicola]|uniref:Uncharacterized protein n=1 Tax=Devosia algicola TaxID=3026418 RepID=A0ABY7YK74_9HYPH|nr:hypothetical protein [Devosia algicola]WDR01686.1 hypothetical protein PSQ19_13135 [Devosia algicola]